MVNLGVPRPTTELPDLEMAGLWTILLDLAAVSLLVSLVYFPLQANLINEKSATAQNKLTKLTNSPAIPTAK
jgi:hypothetical protein